MKRFLMVVFASLVVAVAQAVAQTPPAATKADPAKAAPAAQAPTPAPVVAPVAPASTATSAATAAPAPVTAPAAQTPASAPANASAQPGTANATVVCVDGQHGVANAVGKGVRAIAVCGEDEAKKKAEAQAKARARAAAAAATKKAADEAKLRQNAEIVKALTNENIELKQRLARLSQQEQREPAGGQQGQQQGKNNTCHLRYNGQIVETIMTKDDPECKVWTDSEAKKRGWVPKGA